MTERPDPVLETLVALREAEADDALAGVRAAGEALDAALAAERAVGAELGEWERSRAVEAAAAERLSGGRITAGELALAEARRADLERRGAALAKQVTQAAAVVERRQRELERRRQLAAERIAARDALRGHRDGVERAADEAREDAEQDERDELAARAALERKSAGGSDGA